MLETLQIPYAHMTAAAIEIRHSDVFVIGCVLNNNEAYLTWMKLVRPSSLGRTNFSLRHYLF